MTFTSMWKLAPVFALGILPLFAQNTTLGKHQYERLTAVVPIIGAGTYADPKRPLFAPGPMDAPAAGGIQSFQWSLSDDGNYALVEFVAVDRKAFEPLLKDARVLEAFEKGKVKKEDIETALQKYRKDFKFDTAGEKQK